MRLSSVSPNIQNVVADKEGSEALAAGFRDCVIAAPGYVLVEVDFSGIEAVLTGWYCDDPDYIRLAQKGVHAYLCSHRVGDPANLSWSDADLIEHLAKIKKLHPKDYAKSKKTVHRTAYGSTPYGMHKEDPETFPSIADADAFQRLYYEVCPKLFPWHQSVRQRAHKQHYLGGNDHPYHYKHWFWNVYVYNSKTKKYSLGEDGRRCIAYYPQSTAAGVLYEACLRLVDKGNPNCIAKLNDGVGNPIRGLIHDSILAEVKKEKVDEYIEKVKTEMTRPIPELGGLVIGVEVKVGQNWGAMEVVT